MNIIDLTNTELFESLIEINYDNFYADLHNDYDCIFFSFNLSSKELILTFENTKKADSKDKITLRAENVDFKKIELNLNESIGILTIDSFYRGRFEKKSILFEYSENNKSFFYLEFYEGLSFEFFSDNVKFIIY